MKLFQLVNAQPNVKILFDKLNSVRGFTKAKLMLSRAIKKMEPKTQEYWERRAKLMTEYGTPNEDNTEYKFDTPEATEGFNKGMQELNDSSADVTIEMISIDDLDGLDDAEVVAEATPEAKSINIDVAFFFPLLGVIIAE